MRLKNKIKPMQQQDKDKMLQYAQDSRTDEQYEADYNYGQVNQGIVFQAIPAKAKYLVQGEKYFGDIQNYKPDCFVLMKGSWIPVDIKATWSSNSEQDFKESQTRDLQRIGGYYLFATPYRYALIKAEDVMLNGYQVSVEQSKLNKDSYRYKIKTWYKWESQLPFVKK